jgi:hypothetical protein
LSYVKYKNQHIIDLKTNLVIYVAKAFADKSYAVPDDSHIFDLTASSENGPQFILLNSCGTENSIAGDGINV